MSGLLLSDIFQFNHKIYRDQIYNSYRLLEEDQDMLNNDPNQGLISRNNQQISKQVIKEKKPPLKNKQEEEKETNPPPKNQRSQITYILKTLNFIVGIGYVAFAAYCYAYGYKETDLQTKGPFIRYVLPAYVGLSGLLILLIQCRVGFLVRNLRFFYNYFGRGFFNVYAGLMPFMLIKDWSNLSTFQIITIVVASWMCVIGVLYMTLKCCCCEKEGDRVQLQQRQRQIQRKLKQDANDY